MNASSKLGVLGLTLAVGALCLWLLDPFRLGSSNESVPATVSDEPQSALDDLVTPVPEATGEAREALVDADEDVGSGAAILGRVSSPDDRSIPGATVHLTSLTAEDLDWEGAWYGDDWGRLERASLQGQADEHGRFEFRAVPEAPFGLVLWANHPGFTAGNLALDPDPSSWPESARLVLGPSITIEVAVIDSEGRPATGAQVEQFGTTPIDAVKEIGKVREAQARRLMQHIETTGPDGTARFGALPGEQVFVASLGNLRSVPRKGPAQERIVLTLRETFEVEGTVSMPSWEHLNYVGERRIKIASQDRNVWRTLHTIRSVENGSWGPVVLPCLDVDRYRVRLEGSPIIPAEEFFDPPAPGVRKKLELVTDIGVNVYFRVTNEADELIRDAVAKVKWLDPRRPDHWNFIERRCNADGLINPWSLPSGSMMYEVHAKGYQPEYSSLELTAGFEHSYGEIRLKRAGRLAGRCEHEGVPLRDFEVLVWQQLGGTPTSTVFLDREEGRFELDSVPTGSFFVTASTPGFPGDFPISVQCPPGGTVEVVLEVPTGLVGLGQVVDEQTGEPIRHASIQMFVPASPGPIARWGLPFPVAVDGTFELTGFVPGLNFVRALAPGYSNKVVQKTLDGDVLDFEAIGLSKAQDLRIVLERVDTSIEVHVAGRGAEPLPPRTFGTDNEVVYEGVSAGSYTINFEDSTGADARVEFQLDPGEDWTLIEGFDGPKHLSVELRDLSGRPYPGDFLVVVTFRCADGHYHTRRGLQKDGVAWAHGIDADAVRVVVQNSAGETLASSDCRFTGNERNLVLSAGDEPFDLRVVDADGQPLSSVRVLVTDPTTPGGAVWGTTSETGECRISGVPAHEVRINLQHPIGSHYGVPVDASVRSAELVLDPSARLRFLFRDGATPLAGVACSVMDEAFELPLCTEVFSDSEGRAEILSLAPDHYPVKAWHGDCWPVEVRAEARTDSDSIQIQVRRLADLELEVTNAEGILVTDLAVQLYSIEFKADVADWIAGGRVRAPSGLTTDSAGRLRVERVPHGDYGWSIELPGGELLQGQFTLEVGSNRPVGIALPE